MNEQQPFELPIMVRGYEMDAFGHVNNAVFAQYFEHCRWMALRQWSQQWMTETAAIVVKKLSIEYEAQARVFDELTIRLWVEAIGRTSMTFGQDLRRSDSGEPVAKAEVVVVCVDGSGSPREVPDSWRRALEE